MSKLRIGFVLTGSFCTFSKVMPVIQALIERGDTVTPILSDSAGTLDTRFGTAAAELIANKKFGCMVALQNNRIVPVPLEEVAGKLKTVSLDCDEIRAARAMGISLGQAE